jgi:hypothetical protein
MPTMRVHLWSREEGAGKEATPQTSVRTGDCARADDAGLHIREYAGLDTLPASYADLLETAGRHNLHVD